MAGSEGGGTSVIEKSGLKFGGWANQTSTGRDMGGGGRPPPVGTDGDWGGGGGDNRTITPTEKYLIKGLFA